MCHGGQSSRRQADRQVQRTEQDKTGRQLTGRQIYSGVAIGSSVGHAIGGLFGGGSGAAAAPAEASPQAAQQSQQNEWGSNCSAATKSFTNCMDEHQGNMSICGWYLDQLKACQAAASQY